MSKERWANCDNYDGAINYSFGYYRTNITHASLCMHTIVDMRTHQPARRPAGPPAGPPARPHMYSHTQTYSLAVKP